MYLRSSSVEIKSAREIDAMREVGRLAGETLSLIGASIRPGITTDEINRIAHEDTLKKGARPAPLNYRGSSGDTPFPKSICTSVNEVVCHGIPGSYVLKDGDIVNVDVTHLYKGFHGDTSATFYVGRKISKQAQLVTEVARKSPGARHRRGPPGHGSATSARRSSSSPNRPGARWCAISSATASAASFTTSRRSATWGSAARASVSKRE